MPDMTGWTVNEYKKDERGKVVEIVRTVSAGEEVTDFRGEKWTFDRVSRLPGGNSQGKVLASRPCGHTAQDHGPKGRVYWCTGQERRELYPSVFDLVIQPTETTAP